MESTAQRGIALGAQALDVMSRRILPGLHQCQRIVSTPLHVKPRQLTRFLGCQRSYRSEQHGHHESWHIGAAATLGATAVVVNTSHDVDGSDAVADKKSTGATKGADAPVFTFGAIADVQYADMDDQWDFSRTQIRQYRGALGVLRSAVSEWNTMPHISFIASLGDIIDGHNNGLKESQCALDRVLAEFNLISHDIPITHLIGNHELYNFTMDELRRGYFCTTLNPTGATYYAFRPPAPTPVPWRIIALDFYHTNMITTKENNADKERAYRYLQEKNPNNLRKQGVNWKNGLSGPTKRFVPFNGGFGPTQLAWLRAELADAEQSGDRVILMSHGSIAPGSASDSCLAWDYDEALRVLDEFPGTVTAVFAGHDHNGGYTERNGVHHITMPSPLNVTPETGALAHTIVEVYADKMVIHGRGIAAHVIGGTDVTYTHACADKSHPRTAADTHAHSPPLLTSHL